MTAGGAPQAPAPDRGLSAPRTPEDICLQPEARAAAMSLGLDRNIPG